MRRLSGNLRMRASAAIVTAAAATFSVAALWPLAPATASQKAPDANHPTAISIDGKVHGPVFDGVGAIAGGGGNARLIIDYPPKQRQQILSYLFGPGGAHLQVLKLEIGDDSSPSDGAEPSVESTQGHIDCNSGYAWWLAEQAVRRNPGIQLVGLQWGAPGWVGNTVFGQADITYLLDWLHCAKTHHLTISYLGGWDEHGYKIAWYLNLRKALDAHGYRSVKLMAADSFPGFGYDWQRTWQVAFSAATHPRFKRALGVIAVHDTCGGPTNGFQCQSTPVARHLGLPLWESELGALHGNMSAAAMARSINNGFIQARVTGFLEWPMASAMPPGLLYEGRGMLAANQPRSGFYYVNRIAWAIAQTTQFAQPGWHHIGGASGEVGNSGTYVAYGAPNGRDWSLVTENTGHHPNQKPSPQTIRVHLAGGLKTTSISVWSSDLGATKPSKWFVRRQSIRPSHGTFTYTIPPGYAVSFTSTTGQAHFQYSVPKPSPMHLPYNATPDGSNEAYALGTQEGAFVYRPCLSGLRGQCLEQLTNRQPIWWQKPPQGTPSPYAIVGASTWSSYTVSSKVRIPTNGDSATLIGRYSFQVYDEPSEYRGYEFQMAGNGHWRLLLNLAGPKPKILAQGKAPHVAPQTWHALSLSMHGSKISAAIDGQVVARRISTAVRSGLAGIGSDWSPVQFSGFSVH